MTARRLQGRRRLGLLLAGGVLAVAGCGGNDAAPDGTAVARAYATEVAQATEATREQLAGTSQGADYRDAVAAAGTTRAYAATIRSAADQLGGAEPPPAVAQSHQELIGLYRATADRLDALALRFDAASSERQLNALAQDLSSEVQSYSTAEAQLRAGIDAELAKVMPSPPAP